MKHRDLVMLLIAVLISSLPAAAHAQSTPPALEAPSATQALKVFLDCAECDLEYQRQSVTFVDYVRDRAVADLHILVTTQSTGSGGVSWTVKFIGLGRLQNQDRTFAFATPQRATSDERRRAFAHVFRIGLVGYAADTPIGPQLDVTWRRPAGQASATARKDPWNFWVFRINANGSLGGEQSSTSRSYRLSFSSSRTTENWKINLSANGNADKRTFKIGDDRTIDSRRDGWSFGSLVVKSLGGHTSAGFRASMARSSFSNTDRSTTLAPGLEYDFFPYSESNRRSLAVQYTVGATAYEYREVTIFDKLRETVTTHGVNVSLGLRQPWGSLSAYSSVSQHLKQTDRYRASVSGSTEVSLFEGFSFNMVARYDRIKDQISLRKSSASTEEILLRLRQLATDYSYTFSVGISYSFGSIFNTLVNPRFSGSGGLIIF
ncbi:MAG TPA: DUF481 domain-containing protein [Vicinamibacterales bacterium]|nr:DUF481 domain-containing protein [Vicinamibacterales bacterium]